MPNRTTLLALIVAVGAVACAPPALDPDHASGSSADSTSSKSKKSSKSSSTATSGDDDDDSTATTKPKATTGSSSSGGATTGAPASFAAVYTSLKTSCGSCHLSGAAGAPTFFGADQAATYDDFVNENFNSSPSPLETKGQHSGPALTADQKADVEAWVAADPAK